ncbi:uncharacterized protein TNCV_2586141 [Trichonephila clavipes]|nr:uncharacterized protein TNCV_2586141 [Trichonephila clavipes]
MNVLNVMSEWGLYERKSAVLDGDFEWVCSTITSQNIYGRTPMILLTMRPSRLFVKIRCHAVASTRKKDQHGATANEGQGLLVNMGAAVHEQISRSGGQSEAKPPSVLVSKQAWMSQNDRIKTAQLDSSRCSVCSACRGRLEHTMEWLSSHVTAPRGSSNQSRTRAQKCARAPSCWNQSSCIAANGISLRNSVKTSLRNTYDYPESRSGNRYGPSRRSPNMPAHTLRDQRS